MSECWQIGMKNAGQARRNFIRGRALNIFQIDFQSLIEAIPQSELMEVPPVIKNFVLFSE